MKKNLFVPRPEVHREVNADCQHLPVYAYPQGPARMDLIKASSLDDSATMHYRVGVAANRLAT